MIGTDRAATGAQPSASPGSGSTLLGGQHSWRPHPLSAYPDRVVCPKERCEVGEVVTREGKHRQLRRSIACCLSCAMRPCGRRGSKASVQWTFGLLHPVRILELAFVGKLCGALNAEVLPAINMVRREGRQFVALLTVCRLDYLDVRAVGAQVMSPFEAYAFVRAKIAERDESNQRLADESAQPMPHWAGKD